MALLHPQRPSPFICLPTELLLIILDLLTEPNLLLIRCGEEEKPPTLYSVRHIRALSLVSQRLRRLCIPLLFSSVKFADTQQQQLRLLEAKCTQDPKFANLIRKLDLADVRSPDVLSFLIPRLRSLEWLDLDPRQIDADLLTTVNSHPNLKTVAISDHCLVSLTRLISSTSLSLSKILIHLARLECSPTLQSPAMHSLMNRSARLAHLVLRDKSNIKSGAGTLVIPGLITLDIRVYREPASFMSWLPAFVERHKSLTTITFSGGRYGSAWSRNPDILFPLQFLDAVEREALERTVSLNTFSIFRIESTSLDTWRVTSLELTIDKAIGISGLRIASALAPQLSSLVIRMPPHGRRPIPIDDLVSTLGYFPSLRRLDLDGIYQHLLFEGPAPWDSLVPSEAAQTSDCMIAHAALRWIAARVAQCTPTIELVDLTDEGYDGKGRLMHPWRLKVTYQVRRNPGVEFCGTPQFVMARRFSIPR